MGKAWEVENMSEAWDFESILNWTPCEQNSANWHEIPRTFHELATASSHPAITATPESTQSKQILSFQVTIYFSIKYISVFDFYKNTILRYFWSHVVECTSDDVTQLKGTELINSLVKRDAGQCYEHRFDWFLVRHSLIQRFPSVTKSKPETIFFQSRGLRFTF